MSHITIQTQTISLKAIRQGGHGKCKNINEKIYRDIELEIPAAGNVYAFHG